MLRELLRYVKIFCKIFTVFKKDLLEMKISICRSLKMKDVKKGTRNAYLINV